jgi:acetylornithine deacetylase/succinyl-diaminopimelate desuccinylase-like protein
MTRDDALALAERYLDDGRCRQDLARRVALATESDAGQPPDGLLRDYLRDEMRPSLQALGFEVRLHDNPVAGAPPLLSACRVESAALPTVLCYGHGDVVSGQAGRWGAGRDPWHLAIDGDHWYGRGTADNKGQHTLNLGALAAVLEARAGRLGFNLTWLVEMGEEAASPGLRAFCERERERLRADLFLSSDGPRVQAGRPTLFLGSRGAVNFTLRLRCRERGCHSGNWGGVLRNPATVLAAAIASMVDGQGRLKVAALRAPEVPPVVLAALAEVPIGGGPADPVIDPGWGETALTPAQRLMAANTLEVLALGAGSPQRPVNAIPPEAVAHCQLRFIAGTPWQDLVAIVRQHLAEQGFPDIEVEVTLSGAATRMSPDAPWVRWAAGSIQRSTGQAPHVLPNLAGSLPNEVFADLLGLPTLWVPHSHPSCNQHAPDEHLLAPAMRQGLRLMAGLLWDLGEPGQAPWPTASTLS